MSQLNTVPQRAHGTVFVRFKPLHAAALAGLMLICGLLLMRAGLPDTVNGGDAAPEKDAPEQVWLSVSDDGRVLDYAGPIVFGVKHRVRAMLDEHPGVTTLRITSPGGRVVEARDLSALIRARNLATVAVGNCASACTVMFMAGHERLLAPTTTLGFHRYRSPDNQQREAEDNMAIDRDYFRARGIPDWFIERAFTTPNGGMWRPTLEEMKAANVITAELTTDGARVPVGSHRTAELHEAIGQSGSGSTGRAGVARP